MLARTTVQSGFARRFPSVPRRFLDRNSGNLTSLRFGAALHSDREKIAVDALRHSLSEEARAQLVILPFDTTEDLSQRDFLGCLRRRVRVPRHLRYSAVDTTEDLSQRDFLGCLRRRIRVPRHLHDSPGGTASRYHPATIAAMGRLPIVKPALDEMPSCENLDIRKGQLLVYGKEILSGVPDNIVLTPDSGVGLANGAFLGFRNAEMASRHTLPIGVFEGLRFMCCFRFKIWWMTQRMGSSGNEVPMETQFLLIESHDESPAAGEADNCFDDRTIYTVCLPLLEGAFRTSLQGNKKNELEICVESGDTGAQTSEGLHSVYVNAGTDPFEVIEDAIRWLSKSHPTLGESSGRG